MSRSVLNDKNMLPLLKTPPGHQGYDFSAIKLQNKGLKMSFFQIQISVYFVALFVIKVGQNRKNGFITFYKHSHYINILWIMNKAL